MTVRPPHPQNLAATLPTVRMIIDVSALHHSFSFFFFFLLEYNGVMYVELFEYIE